MVASIVQAANGGSYSILVESVTLPVASTAGNLLVLTFDEANASGNIPTGFTRFAAAAYMYGGDRQCAIAYKVSTGETTVTLGTATARARLYEIANAGDPSAMEVRSVSSTTGSTKSLGAFTAPGDLQIARFAWNSKNVDQTAGAGYTQDDTAHYDNNFNHQASLAMHGSTGTTPQISGPSYLWCGMAVGITSGAPDPTAAFSGDPTSGQGPLTVDFTDESTGAGISAWDWDFGDGSSHGTTQNPTHVYTDPGTYDVSLTVTGTGGSASLTKVAYIHVTPAAAAGVFIDWGDDGFEVGAYDDVSADVVGWVIDRGASAEVTGGSQPGSCVITLQNLAALGVAEDNLYNPAKTTGALYGKLRDGVRVWIGVNSDGKLTGTDPRGLFAGRIADITPVAVGGSVPPTVEITCEDPLGWYARTPVHIDYVEGLAHDAFRQAALIAAGETRYSLAHEIQTMPLSHADTNLLSVLDDINAVNGTRHFIEPADNFSDWYTYRTRNRFWRLDGASDSSLSASSQHVTSTDGWRLSADTVINEQRAAVEPITFTPGTFTVWQAEVLPFEVTTGSPFTRWVEFDDVVRDAVLNIASSGATVTALLTAFATTAKIELIVASGTGTVSALSVEGRLARRLPTESYVADDTASQALPRGIRAGSDIGNEYLGVIAEARGIADHVVWRYASPQFRPTFTVENWFPTQFDRELYEILSFTSTTLAVSARHFEIVGLHHEGDIAASTVQHHLTRYVGQECAVQSDPGWVVIGTSTLAPAGTDILHY